MNKTSSTPQQPILDMAMTITDSNGHLHDEGDTQQPYKIENLTALTVPISNGHGDEGERVSLTHSRGNSNSCSDSDRDRNNRQQ